MDRLNAGQSCNVIELRQYTLKPGQRDVLIELFERAFIESQEDTGMRLIGQFRQLDAPDRFVWLRGFASMRARAESLQRFYDGPVWQEHRTAANATMLDSDNVLLLKPAHAGCLLQPGTLQRAPIGSVNRSTAIVVATLYYLAAPASLEFVEFFDRDIAPLAARAGARIIGALVTEQGQNTWTRLPIREHENVFAWLAVFRDQAAYAAYTEKLAGDPGAHRVFRGALRNQLKTEPEVLQLTPTARSLVR